MKNHYQNLLPKFDIQEDIFVGTKAVVNTWKNIKSIPLQTNNPTVQKRPIGNVQ